MSSTSNGSIGFNLLSPSNTPPCPLGYMIDMGYAAYPYYGSHAGGLAIYNIDSGIDLLTIFTKFTVTHYTSNSFAGTATTFTGSSPFYYTNKALGNVSNFSFKVFNSTSGSSAETYGILKGPITTGTSTTTTSALYT